MEQQLEATTKTKPAKQHYSLFDIEAGWIPLLEARIEAETSPDLSDDRPVCLTCSGRETSVCECKECGGTGRSQSERERAIEDADVALAEHATREIEKADSYIGLIGFLEAAAATRRADAKRQAELARITEAMLAQVKATALNAMDVLHKKRIDGDRGYLLAKANGGVAPLLVDAPAVPDELCRLEGWVNAGVWTRMIAICRRNMMDPKWEPNARWTARVPDNTAIRAKLAEQCPTCEGIGRIEYEPDKYDDCATCRGSGKQGVPGARLGDRGIHLEVK